MAFLDKNGLERLWAHIVSITGGKVDVVEGKGLSTNDYTTEEKELLANLDSLVGDTSVSSQITNAIADKADASHEHSAYVNQNAFSNIKVGDATVSADSTTDTLAIVAGSNVTITPDATNDQITISAQDTTYSNATASAAGLMSADDKATLDNLDVLVGDTAVADQISAAIADNAYSLPEAGSSLGGVKSGGDVTISAGVITVNDDSHNHTIANVDGLQTALDSKSASNHTHSSYANQNAFSNVVVGSTTIAADSVTDTLTLVAGSNITLTPDATNDKVTIAATNTVYTHPNSGVAAGTYKSVTVNAAGHVTGGTNPTTLSGYGITDAAKATDLSALSSLVGDTAVSTQISNAITEQKGAAGGIAELDSNGKVPSTQLPSYVDDVLEYNGKSNFPTTGESGKIYIDTATNKTYRWGGSAYAEISESLALGTTSSTAFRGDYGNTAYTHATAKGSAFSSGLYKITTNDQGHVTAATAVSKSDITALGVPSQDTTYGAATTSAAGLMSASDKSKLDGVASGANKTVVDSSLSSSSTNPVQNKVINAAISNLNTLVGDEAVATQIDNAINSVTLSSLGVTATAAELNKLDGVTATTAELNYVDGVTSNIQTQLNAKAASGHTHSAYVNQNAFSNVVVGSTTVTADNATDTLTLAGSNVTLTPDATNDKVTIGITKDNVVAALGYTPPTTNTTYSAAGSALGLVKSGGDVTISSGVITVNDDSHNHTVANIDGLQDTLNLIGDTSVSEQISNAVDDCITGMSVSGKVITYTKGDGSTGTITTQDTNTTYSAATQSAQGLMSAADKTKLDGIASGANAYSHPTSSGNKHIPSGGSSGQILRWSADGTAVWGADNNTTYSVATTSANGLMSSSDKSKLDGIATGANKTTVDSALSSTSTNPVQNKVVNSAIANLNTLVGDTAVATQITNAIGNGTITITQGGATKGTFTMNQSGDTTIALTDNNTTYSNMTAATSSAAGKAGLVPAPGAGKQASFLRGDGTWVVPTNTTYSNMTAATSSAAGKAGLVPAPGAGKQESFLRGDGTWVVPTNTTYSAATTSAAGLMSATDKVKLDGIATGANKITVDTSLSATSTNPVQNKLVTAKINSISDLVGDTSVSEQISSAVDTCITGMSVSGKVITYTKGDGSTGTITTQDTNTTYSAATTSAQGLMTAADKTKLDGIATGATKVTVDTAMSSSSTNPVQNKVVNSALADKVKSVKTSNVTVLGTSKTTEKVGENQLVFPSGAIFSGTAAAAGLVTRGICGVTQPGDTGACEKDNLYINYDGNNDSTYKSGRQVILQAGSAGTHYGSNLYQYAAARGDAVKGWVESKGYATQSSVGTISSLVGDTAVATQISNAVATKADIASGVYTVTAASSDGVAYTATVPGITTLERGASFIMLPGRVSNSTAPTLNVNGLGAKPIRRRLSNLATAAQAGYTATWLAINTPFTVVYDGSAWIVEGLTKPAVADLYGTLAVNKGGTGATTAVAARENLLMVVSATEPASPTTGMLWFDIS